MVAVRFTSFLRRFLLEGTELLASLSSPVEPWALSSCASCVLATFLREGRATRPLPVLCPLPPRCDPCDPRSAPPLSSPLVVSVRISLTSTSSGAGMRLDSDKVGTSTGAASLVGRGWTSWRGEGLGGEGSSGREGRGGFAGGLTGEELAREGGVTCVCARASSVFCSCSFNWTTSSCHAV